MATLLYHSEGVTESPFDTAILRVARSGPVRIVSPYIGVNYLQRVISISQEWRLLSDVEEWLRSLSTRDRPRAWAFIRANLEQIHHVPDLHAKAVIADSLAVMGSANLTQKGILGRTELGVMLEDTTLVAELCTWFDGIWTSTTPPLVDEASAFIQWLDEEAAQAPTKRQRFAISSDSRKVRARLVKLDAPKPAENAPLDLGVVAQAVIVEDQKHYDSLEAALEAAIDKLTVRRDFTFSQVASETRKGFAGTNLREVYFLLVQHCANHVRSVYVEETQNRLILSDGHFSQSTRESLPGALAPFDAFLVMLAKSLSFDVPGSLPGFAEIEHETGIGDRDQTILVFELLDVGFLLIEDRSGELPWYQLDNSFDGWERRFKLFPRSHAAWEGKRRSPALLGQLMVSRDDEDEPPTPAMGILREDQLPEAVGDEEINFAALEKEFAAGVTERTLRAASTHAKKAQRKHERQAELPHIRVAIKTPEPQSEPVQVDAFLAKLLTAAAGGRSFTAPDWTAMAAKVAQETQSPESVARIALDPVSRHPKVFLVGVKGQVSELQLNPALKWEMLLRYPKTRAICEQLLGT